MSININFGGVRIQRPGAYSLVDTSNMSVVSLGGFKVLAVAGVPNVVNKVYATPQVVKIDVVGTVGSAGTAKVVVNSAMLAGGTKTLNVALLSADTATAVAVKIASELTADTAVGAIYTVTSAVDVITLTAKAININDESAKVTIANGTCTGITASSSAITTAGVIGGVLPFNDPTIAKLALGNCEALDLMSICWQYGADLILFSPVDATATDADWQEAIDLLQTQAVDGVLVANNSASINAKLQVHCDTMSTILNRRERRAFVGHATGLALQAVLALQTFNDELVVMATPGVYVFDANGNKVLKGSQYLASAYAGLWAGKPSKDPITYDYVKFPGIEKEYLGEEINTLLGSGVAPVEYVKSKGYRIVQGLTTSNSSDLTKNELSVSTEKMHMNVAIRDFMEDKYVGKAGVDGIEITMYNDLVTLIEGFLKAGLISSYVKDSVSIVKNGTAFRSQWQGIPTLPINNFLLTSHFTL
jgi:hypothetical protein